jgi:hypothetical protein
MNVNFCPEETPMRVSVLTSFEVRGNVYVVDIDGLLHCIRTEGDDPDLWCWMLVAQL